MIAVLEYAITNKRISNKDGERLAGRLWCNVRNELSREHLLYVDFANDTNLISTHNLEAKLNNCHLLLEEIKNEEYDRELDNKSKRRANKLATWSIVISILAATGLPQEIFRWIYKLLKGLF